MIDFGQRGYSHTEQLSRHRYEKYFVGPGRGGMSLVVYLWKDTGNIDVRVEPDFRGQILGEQLSEMMEVVGAVNEERVWIEMKCNQLHAS